MEKRLERILREVKKRLSSDTQGLLSLIVPELRKDKIVFRMPLGFVSLESVWETIVEVCKEQNIECVKMGMYATVDELDDIFGEVEWLWDNWIPKGFVTLVAADPGVGKSAFVLWLSKCITNGLAFPMSEEKMAQGKIIWVDTESSQQLLALRSKAMKMDRKRIAVPVIDGDILSQLDIGNPEHRQVILDLIDGFQPIMLVVDSLSGSHSRGENKIEDIKPVMEFLSAVARDKAIAVVAIHHLNKGRENESAEITLYRLRGSTAIPANCRSIIGLEPYGIEENRKIKMRMIKTNLAPFQEPLSLRIINNPNGNEIIDFLCEPYVPPPPKRMKKELCADWVVELLEKQKEYSMPLKEIVELGVGSGYTRNNIYAAKEVLKDKIAVGGTGNAAIWKLHLTETDKKSVDKIIKAKKGK